MASDGLIGAASTLIKNYPSYNSGVGTVSTMRGFPYSTILAALNFSGTCAIYLLINFDKKLHHFWYAYYEFSIPKWFILIELVGIVD